VNQIQFETPCLLKYLLLQCHPIAPSSILLSINFHFFAAELQQQIRNEFETFRCEKDPQAIRFYLSDGLQKVKDLKSMLALSVHN
jgi:hypothetical protein